MESITSPETMVKESINKSFVLKTYIFIFVQVIITPLFAKNALVLIA